LVLSKLQSQSCTELPVDEMTGAQFVRNRLFLFIVTEFWEHKACSPTFAQPYGIRSVNKKTGFFRSGPTSLSFDGATPSSAPAGSCLLGGGGLFYATG
jgi:hypothetical protein